jgi:hypothetical protein
MTEYLKEQPEYNECLGAISKACHNILKVDMIRWRNSTVAIAVGQLNGRLELFVSGNGGKLTSLQEDLFVEYGVAKEYIYRGKEFRVTILNYDGKSIDRNATKFANHAERVIIRNIPEGTKVLYWGVSWGGRQRNASCPYCVTHMMSNPE